jgi:hypothetical protein
MTVGFFRQSAERIRNSTELKLQARLCRQLIIYTFIRRRSRRVKLSKRSIKNKIEINNHTFRIAESYDSNNDVNAASLQLARDEVYDGRLRDEIDAFSDNFTSVATASILTPSHCGKRQRHRCL